MKRITAWAVLAAFAAALLLSMLPPVPARAQNETSVGYTVTFTKDSDIVSVKMYFEATDANHSIEPHLTDDAFPEGYFTVKEATDSQGNQLAFAREGQAWVIAGRGKVNVAYEIDLGTLGELTPVSTGINDPAFSPITPHLGSDYVFVPGGYLLLQPRWQGPERVEFDYPEGWWVWSGWEDGTIAGTTDITNGVFAGDVVALGTEGGIPLGVIQPRSSDPANLAAQQEFADKLAAHLSAADEAWGKPGMQGSGLQVCLGGVAPEAVDNRQVLSIPFANRYGCVFMPVGTRENILSTDLLLRAGDQSVRVMLNNLPLPYDQATAWFREGCVHYSNLRFSQKNGWMSGDDLYDRLCDDYALYVDALAQCGITLAGAGEKPLQNPQADLLYAGGTVAAASIDVELAGTGKSLDGFISYLYQNPEEAPFDNHRLLDELWAYAGMDMSVFFNDYITGTAVIPASAFSKLKLDGTTASEDSGNTGNTAAGTDLAPAPAFGKGWILMLAAVLLVFAIPFLLEPYALRPRGGAVTVTEEELEAERLELKKAYWGEHYGEDRGREDQAEEGENTAAAEPGGDPDGGGDAAGPRE